MPPAFIYRILSFLVPLVPLWIRVKIWIRLARLGRKRWESESIAQRLPGGIYMKRAFMEMADEAEILRFVRSHTPLPVPVVIDSYTYNKSRVIIMSALPGENLASHYSEITPEAEQLLSTQLSRILAPLRALTQPSGLPAVCGIGGGPVYCERIRFGSSPAGPWATVGAFHKELMIRAGDLLVPEPPNSIEKIEDVIQRAHSRTQRICLTHNDLGPHNILVDENWNITGIVDWEACAWMPEYWEVTKGTFIPWFRKGKWRRIMSAALPMYALEQEAELSLIEYRTAYC